MADQLPQVISLEKTLKPSKKTEKGNNILITSIIATVAIFVLTFSLPENIIEKIPNIVIPVVYTSAIIFWVEHTFGAIFKQHEESNYSFHSIWHAVGVGVVSLLLMGIGIFGYIYTSSDFETEQLYTDKMQQFMKNEQESLTFYNHKETESDFGLILGLNKKVIPKWKENIEIIKQANAIKNLPSELIEQNKKLLSYCELRIETFELLKKALSESTDKYNTELSILHAKIEKQLEAINQ